MIRTWKYPRAPSLAQAHFTLYGGRTYEPVSEAKRCFCVAAEAEAGSRRPEVRNHV